MAVYEIVALEALPSVDLSKTVRSAIFSPTTATRVQALTRRLRTVTSISHLVAFALFPLAMLTTSNIGRPLALVQSALELPAYLIAILALRADIVRFLLSSYDYWFFTATTLVYTVAFSRLLPDERASISFVTIAGYQLAVLIDAGRATGRRLILGAVLGILLLVFVMVLVTLDRLGNAASHRTDRRTLSTRDMFLNAATTMQILLLRIVLRKHKLLQRSASVTNPTGSVTVQFVTIKCSTKMRLVQDSSASEHQNPRLRTSSGEVNSDRNVRLRHVRSANRYDSINLLMPALVSYNVPSILKIGLHAIGITGFVSTTICGALSQAQSANATLLQALSSVAIACTVIFAATTVAFYHRTLLAHVCFSFDFVFLSIQITIAHLCACDMLQWRLAATSAIACAWLWIHLVLTLDALTPAVKDRLGFRSHWCAAPVLIVYLCGQVALCVGGVFFGWWPVENRELLRGSVWGHDVVFHVVPMFVNRLLTVSLWSLRLLWRFCHDVQAEKLIMLRGQVEFEYDPRRGLQVSSPHGVVPTMK